jgi:calcineurin-like phosphoesterase family protein
MRTYVTSDLHLNHPKILDYCPTTRNFASVAVMNEWIIDQYNSIVTADDTVYFLGDMLFGQVADGVHLIQHLNGNKILIQGNHDFTKMKHPEFRACFNEIHQYKEITFKRQKIVMFHYPIVDWNLCSRGSIHLHGHRHGNPTGNEQYRSYDVGYDATGKIVSLLDDIVDEMLTRAIKDHH